MRLIFNSVEFENFMSFEKASLDLPDRNFTLIQGENNSTTDGASSNGSGKSTIFEAIYWCLTGTTIRGSKDVVNKANEDYGCYVALDFTLDGSHINLIRAKGHKQYGNNLLINIDGKDISGKGIRDSQKIFEGTFPDLSSDLIGSVIILGQGLPQRFTGNTPAGRKQILEQLTKSDYMIEDLKVRTTSRDDELTSLLKTVEMEKSRIQGQMDALETRKSALLKQKEESNEEQLRSQLKQLKDNQLLLDADITTKVTELERLNEKLQSDRILLSENKSKSSALSSQCASEQSAVKIKYNEQLIELTSEKNSLTDYINHAEAVTDVCPTCGQKLVGIEKIDCTDKKHRLQEVVSAIVQLQDKINVETSSIESTYRDAIDDVNRILSELNLNINNIQNSVNKVTQDKRILDNQYSKLSNDIQALELTIARTSIDYDAEISKIDDEIHKFQSEFLYNDNEKIKLTQHQEVVKKFLTYLKRDFRGYLLQQYIDFLNTVASKYCTQLFGENELSIYLDGNNLAIDFAGKEYESLSGGERQKVDLLVQFSIRELLGTTLNFTTNILALDEITDNLDEEGCQRLMSFIFNTFTDLSSVYIISHRKDMTIPYDNMIKVVKSSDGVSYLR